jgi:hypothetical protein
MWLLLNSLLEASHAHFSMFVWEDGCLSSLLELWTMDRVLKSEPFRILFSLKVLLSRVLIQYLSTTYNKD